jgi:hypothetical protein
VTDFAISEATRLAELEQAIERGLQTFVEVGEALREIRDSRLYRQDFGSFEGYCRERWGFSRPRAYELIQGADVVSGIPDTAPAPATVGQARELAPLKDQPGQMGDAMQEASSDGAPTAAIARWEAVRLRRLTFRLTTRARASAPFNSAKCGSTSAISQAAPGLLAPRGPPLATVNPAIRSILSAASLMNCSRPAERGPCAFQDRSSRLLTLVKSALLTLVKRNSPRLAVCYQMP